MELNQGSNRRQFFGQILTGLGLSAFAVAAFGQDKGKSDSAADKGKSDSAADKGAAAAPKLVDENDPVAKALKFKHDKSQVEQGLLVTKMGVEGKDQTCGNCIHYKGQDGGVGTCNMLMGKGVVKEAGWCNVWTKKA